MEVAEKTAELLSWLENLRPFGCENGAEVLRTLRLMYRVHAKLRLYPLPPCRTHHQSVGELLSHANNAG